MEMNVSSEPEWEKKFQEYFKTEYNFSKLDAIGTIDVLSNSDETFSLWDYSNKTTEGIFKAMVKMHFSRAFANSYSQSTTERCAKQLADELKKRYDMQFAALIVDNLKKHNLLADDRLAELIKKD